MAKIDLNRIKDEIGREVVAAIVAEPMVMKYLYEYDTPIHLWRNDVSIHVKSLRYTKKAVERIAEKNPHLFKAITDDGSYWCLLYADELKARMRKREQERQEQWDREEREYAHVADISKAYNCGEPYKDLHPLKEYLKADVSNSPRFDVFYYDPYHIVGSMVSGEYGYACPMSIEQVVVDLMEKYHIPYEVKRNEEYGIVRFSNNVSYLHHKAKMQPYWND